MFDTGGVNWPKVTCQATQKRPWMEKHPAFSRGGRQTEQRNNSQVLRVRLDIRLGVRWMLNLS